MPREADRREAAREAARRERRVGEEDGAADEVEAGGARGGGEQRREEGAGAPEAGVVDVGGEGEVAEVVRGLLWGMTRVSSCCKGIGIPTWCVSLGWESGIRGERCFKGGWMRSGGNLGFSGWRVDRGNTITKQQTRKGSGTQTHPGECQQIAHFEVSQNVQ